MSSNNVLVLGPPNSGKLRICQFLSKDLDTSTVSGESHSGLVYNYDLKTKYYGSNVNLLVEEYPDNRDHQGRLSDSLQMFYQEFMTQEFVELREALDGLIFTISTDADGAEMNRTIDIMCNIKELLQDNDIFCIVVGFYNQGTDLEAVEDTFMASGIEFVNFHDSGKNEFHEFLGRDRLYDVLASHEWSHRTAPVTDAAYKNNKMESVQEMSKSLVEKASESEEADIGLDKALKKGSLNHSDKDGCDATKGKDLAELFSNLKFAKEKSQGMSLEQKKAFVDELVEEYINYF